MSVMDWAGLLVSISTIIGGFTAAVRWLVKHYLSELKTNGGSSMRDEIKFIKIRQDEADILRRDMDKKLERVEDRLDQVLMLLINPPKKSRKLKGDNDGN